MSFQPMLDLFKAKHILVVGDVMLDEYIFGTATRISPEAPVMVVKHKQTSRLPGGAANVAKNVLAFGASAHLVGVVGDDQGGTLLRDALEEVYLPSTLITIPGRVTTRKTRVLADSKHQVLRIDQEDDSPIADGAAQELLDAVEHILPQCDAIILSDYLKGSIIERVARVVYQMAKSAWKPVIVNPKPQSLEFYRGATVISLNRAEATQAYGSSVTLDNALPAAEKIRSRHRAEAVVVTLGDEGMAVAGPVSLHIPAPVVEVSDPAGAGDTGLCAQPCQAHTAGDCLLG